MDAKVRVYEKVAGKLESKGVPFILVNQKHTQLADPSYFEIT